ncbi:hypothetical protein [Psychroserpens luteolus]|uniref:hypothetical protein n=1 Tax=Psychroserpens luteolus TaxID=2855840 RepID=UPI001E5B2611|nr:hypothetical protein [Psychroserpens luteolus]MCD2260437.1 hypothetical protein [Psychroserpens luteolus]
MKACFSCVFVLLLLSCNSKEKEEKKVVITDGTKTYDVYQASEMSTLMKGMYAYNMQLKTDIEAGNEVSDEFPEEFLRIHSAQLSETKLRNETFQHFSGKFIDAQREVFIDSSLLSVKERYNNSINMCLSCHKTECTGPIPKIQKLLIK